MKCLRSILMSCPDWTQPQYPAYFGSAADTLIGVNFPLGTPWALGKVDRVGNRTLVGLAARRPALTDWKAPSFHGAHPNRTSRPGVTRNVSTGVRPAP